MVDLRLDQLSMSLDAQIQNLKDDGVKFEICDEGEAKKYLLSHNYLFRMKRYAVNFDCDEQDKYKNLDFALLKDLAIIDYEFRLMLEYITSNAEHALKLRFNTLLMQDPVCDGYKVSQLVDPDGEFLFDLQKGYQKRSKVHFSPYSDDLVKKYFPNPEIWNLWSSLAYLIWKALMKAI